MPGRVSLDEAAAFLAARHSSGVEDVEILRGGFWSAAFGYRADGRELVVRFGERRDWFEVDRAAMAFAAPDLPVPEVLEIGDAFGGAYAISVRHHGRFLEDVRPDEAAVAGPAVVRTLDALRRVSAPPHASTAWHDPGSSPDRLTWRRWLTDGLIDHPHRRVSGWRRLLAADEAVDQVFRAAERRVGELAKVCPERRDLVHGDLLNRNVLVADDGSQVTAVFSWKCSVRGDFLFDVAWCTFWGTWRPGVAAMDLWHRTANSSTLAREDLADAAIRHHCYELQIGASHLGWNAWCGKAEELRAVAARTRDILSRGPLADTQ